MATRRIKEITNTATTFASDDFIALDGTTQGTRKMDKDDLIAEVSAGVSGDYLEEANNLSDVASLDTSKLNMEIPDVGTAPNEVPLSGQLGTMAFQDSAGVSVGQLEVTDKVKGPLGIDGSPGSYAYSGADDLVVGDASGSRGITISTGSSDTGALYFGDAASTGLESYRGMVRYSHSSDKLELGTLSQVRATIDSSGRLGVNQSSPGSLIHVKDDADATNDGGIQIERSTNSDKAFFNMRGGRVGLGSESGVPIRFYVSGNNKWTIGTGGNLVASASGVGIDFVSTNSTSGVTVTGSTLDHYEEGTWTGTFRDATSGGNASSTFPGVYTRIGDVVYFRIGCGNINTSAMTAGNVIYLHGLPFQASASKSGPVNAVQVDTVTTGDYLTVAANAGTSYCDFRKNTSGAGDAQLLVSDLTSGTSDMTVSGWYYA